MENIQYVSGRDSSTTQSWAKNGRVYSSDSASSLMPDSLTSNSFFIPSNHIPVRFVRWPHIPQIMRPSFTNNRLFSHYRTVQGMMPVYPCSHLTGTSILSQPSEMTTNVPSELNSLAENSFSDDSSVIYEQCSEAISENITRSNGDISQNNVLFVNETNNSDNERENAEHILTEITKEHEDTTEKDIIENEESYSNCMDEKDHENMSYALNDIAYEIEVETNNENDLINEVLNESYSEENDESEKITFNTIEEVLTAIDDSKQNQDYSLPFELSGETSRLNIKMGPGVQEEVVKAAKSLFSKRTRTLYHWLYPDTSKTKLKATVTTAWDTLPENEKHFYMSQVLGRFGLQAGNLMINPQLDGIKGFSSESIVNSEKDIQQKINIEEDLETDQAVDDLLASCGQADEWLTYETMKNENIRKRKRDDTAVSHLSASNVKEDNNFYNSIAKQMREVSNSKSDFEDDTELNNELIKFQIFNDIESITANHPYLWTQSSDTSLFDNLEI